MARAARGKSARSGPPDSVDRDEVADWLAQQPIEWSVVLAARAALRTLPWLSIAGSRSGIVLPVIRAASIALFAARYPVRAADAAAHAQAASLGGIPVGRPGDAAFAAAAAARTAGIVGANISASDANTIAAAAAASAVTIRLDTDSIPAIRRDMQVLDSGTFVAGDLARRSLWLDGIPPRYMAEWYALATELLAEGNRWNVWTEWYDHVLLGLSSTESVDASFTGIPGELPWEAGALAVNTEIERRLNQFPGQHRSAEAAPSSNLPTVPAQRPAAIEPIWDAGILKIPRGAAKTDLSGRKFASALKALRAELSEFADEISAEANIDPRFVAQLRRLAERIPNKLPRQDELFRIGHLEGVLESYANVVKEEWPAHLAARYQGLTLHFDRTMRQSPVWREFKQNAAKQALTEQQISEAPALAKEMARALKDDDARQFVDPALPEAIELLADKTLQPTSSEGSGASGAEELLAADLIDSVNNVLKRIAEAAIATTKPLASAGAAAGATLSKASKGFVTEYGKGLVRGAKKEGKRAGEDTAKWLRRIVFYGGSAAAGAKFGLPALIAKFPTIADWLTKISHFL
jgi:hypothetical protein